MSVVLRGLGCIAPGSGKGRRRGTQQEYSTDRASCDRTRMTRVYFKLVAGNGSSLCPTFLEGVGANHRVRSGRLTPSRKVGGAPNLKYAPMTRRRPERAEGIRRTHADELQPLRAHPPNPPNPRSIPAQFARSPCRLYTPRVWARARCFAALSMTGRKAVLKNNTRESAQSA
jgi:hypothetical protein